MIAALRGTLTARAGDLITIATAGGVSYEVAVPLGVLERLPPPGRDVQLHTVLVVREDGWSLFGFDRVEDRTVFQRLLGASGVGPRLALALLSALGGDRVVRAVQDNDLAALCTVSGVGKKKAERMVVELRDRFEDLAVAAASPMTSAGAQATRALVNLGYPQLDADEAVRAALAADGAASAADLIRRALQGLSRPG